MGLSYTDVRAIVIDVLNDASKDAELEALRTENAKLKADIAAAVDKTDVIEQGAREGLPASPQ